MANNQSSTLLLCAYTLAKAKRYAEAEAMILSNAEVAKTPPAIDLLARLRVEQGDLIEARRLWEDLASTNPDYLPARNALKNFDIKPSWFTKKRCFIGAMILLFLGGLFLGRYFYKAEPLPQAPLPQTYTWATFPRFNDLQSLQIHKGKIKRISISSHLFADPSALARRQNLLDILTHLLDVQSHQIYFAQNTPNAAPEAVVITIETN